MRKVTIIIFSIILFFASPVSVSFAISQVPTIKPTQAPTNTQKDESLSQQIEAIKDKIASTVAKLKLVDNRGIIGTVADTATTQLSITDLQGNIRFIDVDQITKFSSPSAKTTNFGISDLTKGMTISVLGKYNKDNKRMLGRFINVISLPSFLSGTVTSIDKANGVFTIASVDKHTYTFDVQNVTKTYLYDADANETKSGFSKMELGERIFVVGYPENHDLTHISATRVLLFPVLPANPHISANVTRPPETTPSDTPAAVIPNKKVTPVQ